MPVHWQDDDVDIVDVLEGNLDGPYVTVIASEDGTIEYETFDTGEL